MLAVSVAVGPMTALASAAGQPDNFGQCQRVLVQVFGVNPSVGAPGRTGLGPAVIIYDQKHIVAIHQASAFSFGAACNLVLDPSQPVQSASVDNDGALLVVRQT